MPIKYETKESWGAVYYLKDDPEQVPHRLIEIRLSPGKVRLRLSHQGIKCWVHEFETTRTPDIVKKITGENDEED